MPIWSTAVNQTFKIDQGRVAWRTKAPRNKNKKIKIDGNAHCPDLIRYDMTCPIATSRCNQIMKLIK
jgi:hypothetical protein